MNFIKTFFEFVFLIILSTFMFFYLIIEELYKKLKKKK